MRMECRYCGSEIVSKGVPTCDPLVPSFSPEAGHSLPTAKLLYFGLTMTTAFDIWGSVGSWQSLKQDKVGVGVDLDRFYHVAFTFGGQWRPMAANVYNASLDSTRHFKVR